MNARLIKETRSVLPMLGGLLLVLVVPYLIWRADAERIGYVIFGVACAVLAGCAFGNEFEQRTLWLLLSQPIPRSVLWRDKMLVLGGGLAASVGVLVVCILAWIPVAGTAMPIGVALTVLCAFCGGPYWTLMFRRTLAGMAAAAGAPLALVILTAAIAQRFSVSEEIAMWIASILIVLYCGVVYWLGYSKFQRLELADAVARELALPAGIEAALTSPLAKLSARFSGAFGSLVKKEFRVQQVSFILAALFFLIAVAGYCLYPRSREWGRGILIGDHMFYMIILPLIAGGVSVGEERVWGLAEWHLTLPPSARQQWGVKMLVTLSTSLALGLFLPAVMFFVAARLLGEPGHLDDFNTVWQVCGWVLFQLFITSTAVYSATFTRSSLWAILSAFLLLCAAGVLAWLTGIGLEKTGPLSLRWVGHPKVVAALIAPFYPWVFLASLGLIQCFAWSNFRRCGVTPLRVLTQVVAILLVIGLTLAIWFSAESLARR